MTAIISIFFVVKKIMENKNDNNNNRSFYIRTYIYRCFYVSPTFYKVYKELDKAHHIFARFEGSEAIFVYQNSLKNIRQYVTEDKPYFFHEGKKLLIQYYITVTESCRQIKNHI